MKSNEQNRKKSLFKSAVRASGRLGARACAPSDAYQNYDKMREKIVTQTMESQIDCGAAFVGTPSEIIEQLEVFNEACEGCDEVSMQVNYFGMDVKTAEASIRLFGDTVIPHFHSESTTRTA